jgi:hypothetical protein
LKTNPNLTGAMWHFFVSTTTQIGGAAPEVLQALQNAGIKYASYTQ